jgi:hypothetical protein
MTRTSCFTSLWIAAALAAQVVAAPVVRDHRQTDETPTADSASGGVTVTNKPRAKKQPWTTNSTPTPGPVVRDHRTNGPVIRDHRTGGGPIVRDHRDQDNTVNQGTVVVRDHRTQGGVIIRDHRNGGTVIVRDHRDKSPVIPTPPITIPPKRRPPIVWPPTGPLKDPPKDPGPPNTPPNNPPGTPPTDPPKPPKPPKDHDCKPHFPWWQFLNLGASAYPRTVVVERPVFVATPVVVAAASEPAAPAAAPGPMPELTRLSPGMEVEMTGAQFGEAPGKAGVKVGDIVLVAEVVTWRASEVIVRLPVVVVVKPVVAEILVLRPDGTLAHQAQFELVAPEK